MSIEDPHIIGLYSRPGNGKTSAVVEAMGLGDIFTPAKSNLVSTETLRGVKIDKSTGFNVKVCGSLTRLLDLLNGRAESKNGAKVVPAIAAPKDRPLLIDDIGVMADGFIAAMRPYCVTSTGKDDTRNLFGELASMVDNVVDAMKNAQARGCDVYITSHYREPKKNQETGAIILPTNGAKLGFYMPSEGNIEKIARVCRSMVQVLIEADGFSPAFKCDRGHPYEWYKNHLNLFERIGPASLAEYLRAAGRTVPRIKGTEWMEDFVESASQMLADEQEEDTILAWLAESGVSKKAWRTWIYQDAFTRNWLRSNQS